MDNGRSSVALESGNSKGIDDAFNDELENSKTDAKTDVEYGSDEANGDVHNRLHIFLQPWVATGTGKLRRTFTDNVSPH